MLAAPGAAKAAADFVGTEAAAAVAAVFSAAVPIVGAVLAVSSAHHAIKVMKNPKASKLTKAFAVGHAISDAIRVVFPLVGVLGNAALVAAQAATTYVKLKKLKAERAAQPPTGPPPTPLLTKQASPPPSIPE